MSKGACLWTHKITVSNEVKRKKKNSEGQSSAVDRDGLLAVIDGPPNLPESCVSVLTKSLSRIYWVSGGNPTYVEPYHV